jgi:vacuolar-type H+-ATPase subunit C/Vma6
MYDYGNARVAVLRSRLLPAVMLATLAESDAATTFLATLDRSEDWRPIIRRVGPLVADPAAAVQAAIERHRAARLGALPGWYPQPARALVEALVLPLDLERVVAILRRRHAGEDGERVSATIVGGAVLDVATLGRVARASSLTRTVDALVLAGLVTASDRPRLRALAEAPDGWPAVEAGLVDAVERARAARARRRGADAEVVRRRIADDAEIRAMVAAELEAGGLADASALERHERLLQLDRAAARGRREPLGIGPVVAYVAAVEAQAIRLRAALARVIGGWSVAQLAVYRPEVGR